MLRQIKAFIALGGLLMAMTSPARAELFYDVADHYRYALTTSIWTTHFNPRPEHNNHQEMIGIERFGTNFITQPIQDRVNLLRHATPLVGFSYFQNSYSQSTIYAYAGFRQPFVANHQTQLYGKITAGFIHGYRAHRQHSIPFNQFGTSPAVLPSVGLQHRRFNAEMIVFGASGVMLLIGYSF